MLYFAYGSNMNLEQMKKRCPEHSVIGIGYIENYSIFFPRYSSKRGCGVSSIQQNNGVNTWGVIYKLSPQDFKELDKSEGYKKERRSIENTYYRNNAQVLTDNTSITAITYFANIQEGHHMPNKKYMDIIISGAIHHSLPEEYIDMLNNINCNY